MSNYELAYFRSSILIPAFPHDLKVVNRSKVSYLQSVLIQKRFLKIILYSFIFWKDQLEWMMLLLTKLNRLFSLLLTK